MHACTWFAGSWAPRQPIGSPGGSWCRPTGKVDSREFIEQPLPSTAGGTRLGRLIDSVRSSLGEPHTLDSLASEARMSRRSFTRHFKALTGATVQSWLLAERLVYSQAARWSRRINRWIASRR